MLMILWIVVTTMIIVSIMLERWKAEPAQVILNRG
jgi:hypothetical protein